MQAPLKDEGTHGAASTERNRLMERIDNIDIMAEASALEDGHDLAFHTFDEYGRLMDYARVIDGMGHGQGCVLTVCEDGDDMRHFDGRDGEDLPDLRAAIDRLGAIWPGRTIWYERDGGIPGVDSGIGFADLYGGSLIRKAVKGLERGIEPDGEQAAEDERTVERAGLSALAPSFPALFSGYICAEYAGHLCDGMQYDQAEAWTRETYRAMLRELKPDMGD